MNVFPFFTNASDRVFALWRRYGMALSLVATCLLGSPLATAATEAIEGRAREGYLNLAFIDVSDLFYADGKSQMEQLRRSSELPGRRCWVCEKEARYGVWFLYLFRLPDGLTPEIASNAADGGRGSIREVQRILRTFKDPEDGMVIDGLIIYQRSEGEVRVYGLTGREGDKLISEVKTVKNNLSLAELDAIIESISRKMMR